MNLVKGYPAGVISSHQEGREGERRSWIEERKGVVAGEKKQEGWQSLGGITHLTVPHSDTLFPFSF